MEKDKLPGERDFPKNVFIEETGINPASIILLAVVIVVIFIFM